MVWYSLTALILISEFVTTLGAELKCIDLQEKWLIGNIRLNGFFLIFVFPFICNL